MDVCVCVSVSAELPLAPPSGHGRGDEVLVGSASGLEPPVRTLLEQLVELWGDERCGSAPLHLLFASLTVTAVLKANDVEVCPPPLLGCCSTEESSICLPVFDLGKLTHSAH